MQFCTLHHIQSETYSTLNPHLFTTYYYNNKLVFNKPTADSEMPATEEIVRSNATLFLSSSKHINVCCFKEHTDTPLNMKSWEFKTLYSS
jgi:hypothetical protein